MTTGSHKHEFAFESPSIPQLIWSISGMHLPSDCFAAEVRVENLDCAGFTYGAGNGDSSKSWSQVVTRTKPSNLYMHWMTLPELTTCHIQEGHLGLELGTGKKHDATDVRFVLPFEAEDKVVVYCWLTGFAAQPSPDTGSEVRSLKVEAQSISNVGFKLAVSSAGMDLKRVSVGWVAHRLRPSTTPVPTGETGKTETQTAGDAAKSTSTPAPASHAASPTEPKTLPEQTADSIISTGHEDLVSGTLVWRDPKQTVRRLRHPTFGPDEQPVRTFCAISQIEYSASKGFKADFEMCKMEDKDDQVEVKLSQDAEFTSVVMVWLCTPRIDE